MFLSEIVAALVRMMSDPGSLVAVLIGVFWGTTFGATPGLTTNMSMSILVPLTYGVDTTRAIAFLMGAFFGGVYGGSLSAILLKIPGTPSAIMTVLDGYPMAQRGEAGLAIGYATIGSMLGGLISLVLLAFAAPLLARIALSFSAEEFAALAILGLTVIAYISPGSTLKALAAGVIGLFLSMVGMDFMTAYPRFTFGSVYLYGGLSTVPLCIGLFGLSEILQQIEEAKAVVVEQKVKAVLPKASEFVRMKFTILRSALIGAALGAIPGPSTSISAAVAYAQEKRYSNHPEQFGTGVPEGIVAPETANNACVGGALIPLMTLGVPGDSITAILAGALLIHGLKPGPLLFKQHPDFVASVVVSLGLAIILTTIVGLLCVRGFAKVLSVPNHFFMPIIFVLCIVGSYALRNSLFDVGVMLVFGILGYAMNKVNVPISPIILGFMLGQLLEENLRRALMLSGGSLRPFITRPVTVVLLILTVLTLAMPLLKSRNRERECNHNFG